MDKRLIVLAVLVLGGLGYYFYSENKCKEASAQEVKVARFVCENQLDIPTTKKAMCQKLKGTDECKLYQEQDGDAVDAFLAETIAPCVNELLEAQKFCKIESK